MAFSGAADAAHSESGWGSLDRNTQLRVLAFLAPRDLAAAACACHDLRSAALDNQLWVPLLNRHYGVAARAPESVPVAWQAYKAARRGVHRSHAVRFVGLYTDGGMDDRNTAYWVDNMFVPGGWSVYCTQQSPNVHCLGMLKAVHADDPYQSKHRAELVHAAADVAWMLFADPAPMQLRHLLRHPPPDMRARLRAVTSAALSHWLTTGLEKLFLELVMLYGLMGGNVEDAAGQTDAGQQQQQQQGADAAAAGAAAGSGCDESSAGGGAAGPSTSYGTSVAANCQPPQQPRPQIDLGAKVREVRQGTSRTGTGRRSVLSLNRRRHGGGRQLWDARSHSFLDSPLLQQTTAIIDALVVSRAGEFTCPISTGAVFMATLQPDCGSGAAEEAASADADSGAAAVHGGAAAQRIADEGFVAAAAGAGAGPAQPAAPQCAAAGAGGPALAAQQQGAQQRMAALAQQPYVQVLNDKTDRTAVFAASAAGLLPPIRTACVQPNIGEWIEFERPAPLQPQPQPPLPGRPHGGWSSSEPGGPTADPSADGASSSPCLWPVVWFRFFPYAQLGDDGGDEQEEMALPPMLLAAPQWVAMDEDDDSAAGSDAEQDQQQPGEEGLHGHAGADGSGDDSSMSDDNAYQMLLEAHQQLHGQLPPGDGPQPAGPPGMDDDGDQLEPWPTSDDGEDDDGEGSEASGSCSDGEGAEEDEAMQREMMDGDDEGGVDDDDDDAAANEKAGDEADDDDALAGPTPMEEGSGPAGWHTAGAAAAAAAEREIEAIWDRMQQGSEDEGYDDEGEDDDGDGHGNGGRRNDASMRSGGDDGAGSDGGGGSSVDSAEEWARTAAQAVLDGMKNWAVAHEGNGAGGGSLPARSRRGGGGSLPARSRRGGGGGDGDAAAGRGCDDAGGSGDGGGGVAQEHLAAGPLLDGVDSSAWFKELQDPGLAGVLLGTVAEAAGIQAVRHTFQIIQAALQREFQFMLSFEQRRYAHRHRQRHEVRLPPSLMRASSADAAPLPTAPVPGAAHGPPRPMEADAGGAASGCAAGPPGGERSVGCAQGGAAAAAAGAGAAGAELAAPAPVARVLPSELLGEPVFAGVPKEVDLEALAAAAGAREHDGGAAVLFGAPQQQQPATAAAAPAEQPPLLQPPPQQQQQDVQPSGAPHGPAVATGGDAAAAAAAPPPPAGHLRIPLRQYWSGNTVLVKLITPEDRMEHFGEPDDMMRVQNGLPNIDVQFIAFRGCVLSLQQPLQLR